MLQKPRVLQKHYLDAGKVPYARKKTFSMLKKSAAPQKTQMENAGRQTSTPRTIYLGVPVGYWSSSHASANFDKSRCKFRTCRVLQAVEAAGNDQAAPSKKESSLLCVGSHRKVYVTATNPASELICER